MRSRGLDRVVSVAVFALAEGWVEAWSVMRANRAVVTAGDEADQVDDELLAVSA